MWWGSRTGRKGMSPPSPEDGHGQARTDTDPPSPEGGLRGAGGWLRYNQQGESAIRRTLQPLQTLRVSGILGA